jgi:hypothetical protein
MPLNVLLAGGADSTMRQAFAQAAQDVAAGGDVLVTPGPFRRAHEIDEVRAMAHKHGIGLIVPTIDDDLPLWAALAAASRPPAQWPSHPSRSPCAMTATSRASLVSWAFPLRRRGCPLR